MKESLIPKRIAVLWEVFYHFNPKVADSLKVAGKPPPWVYIENGEAEPYWGPN